MRNKIESKRGSKKIFWKFIVKIKDLFKHFFIYKYVFHPFIYLKFKYNYSQNKGKLPDFLIVGVQKGGTTSLWHHLRQHPDIEMSPNFQSKFFTRLMNRKEVHFFDNNKNWERGKRWYKALFNDNSKLQGEASPGYIFYAKSHERMAGVVPNVKIILILRNPVDRAYSAHKMFKDIYFKKFGKVNKESFETLVKRKGIPHFLLERGFYINQIEGLLKYYPREQLLILKSEEMRQDPLKVYKKVFDFLGVDHTKVKYDPHINAKKYSPMDEKTRKMLIKKYLPYNKRLFKFLGYKIKGWEE